MGTLPIYTMLIVILTIKCVLFRDAAHVYTPHDVWLLTVGRKKKRKKAVLCASKSLTGSDQSTFGLVNASAFL